MTELEQILTASLKELSKEQEQQREEQEQQRRALQSIYSENQVLLKRVETLTAQVNRLVELLIKK